MILAALAILSGFALPDTLAASDGARFRAEGVTIRLLAEPADADGQIRGAILFDLEPGWKTYWTDPGAAGLPPEFAFPGAREAETFFPVPKRLFEGTVPFNGYDAPVAVAFQVQGQEDGRLDLAVNAGICREICVPVSARLSRDPGDGLDPTETAAIERAFLSLPGDRGETLAGRIDGNELVVAVRPDDDAAASDLFVSGPSGWSFGPAGNDATHWRIPIRNRPPAGADLPSAFEATLDDGSAGQRLRIVVE